MNDDDLALQSWWTARLAETEPTLKGANITALWWSFSVTSDGIVTNADDINQCISIIAGTPQGADPHRPTFASGLYQHLDKPMNQAVPLVRRELIEAIDEWEPRVELDTLSIYPYSSNLSELTMQATWLIPNTVGTGTINVSVGLPS